VENVGTLFAPKARLFVLNESREVLPGRWRLPGAARITADG